MRIHHHDMPGHRGHHGHARHGGFGPEAMPFGPFGHGPGGRRGRGRRGNTRAAVLGLLLERPMHGYEMISELEQRTGGFWRPSPGSIYPTLQMLEDEGLIVSETTDGRKRFSLTESGQAAAEAAGDRRPWDDLDQDRVAQAQEFRAAGGALRLALAQVAATGTEEQRRQALEILVDARKRIYALLAE